MSSQQAEIQGHADLFLIASVVPPAAPILSYFLFSGLAYPHLVQDRPFVSLTNLVSNSAQFNPFQHTTYMKVQLLHKRSCCEGIDLRSRAWVQVAKMHPLPQLPSVLSSSRTSAPQNTVPIDPTLIDEIEKSAEQVSADVVRFLGNLKTRMDEITSYTHESVGINRQAVKSLSNSIEESIAQMTGLINAVDELSHDMTAVEALAGQMWVFTLSLGRRPSGPDDAYFQH
ncbi:hypothetical protein SpCBS45565_g05535 [Spizellomyces sp. 'palustris']|nr:hypothetical protein SpCBS45565_g05535 [Spizellomyces sp. 'palustris']